MRILGIYKFDEEILPDIWGNEDLLVFHSDQHMLVFNKDTLEVKRYDCKDYDSCCSYKSNIMICWTADHLYKYKITWDNIKLLLDKPMNEIYPELWVQKTIPTYEDSDMWINDVNVYEDNLLVLTDVGIARLTEDFNVVWKNLKGTQYFACKNNFGYYCDERELYRVNLADGTIDDFTLNGLLPDIEYRGYKFSPRGNDAVFHNGLLWRSVMDKGCSFVVGINPITGHYDYIHLFSTSNLVCSPFFANDTMYVQDLALDGVLHVLEQTDEEPTEYLMGAPFSKSEDTDKVIEKKVNYKQEAPTYSDDDIPLFNEVKKVAKIDYAWCSDSECVDGLQDYCDLIQELLSMAGVRKYTLEIHKLSHSIILKKGHKKVELIPNKSDYIDEERLLPALNEFLAINKVPGHIYSLWHPDMLQAMLFFYTEDVEAVNAFIETLSQEDEFEKGAIIG